MAIDFDQIQHQKVPAVQAELDRQGGSTGRAADLKTLLFMGYKLSTGSAAAHALDRVVSASQGKSLYGEGSMLAGMIEAALDVNPRSPIYGMPFAEAGGAVAATGTITVTGPATAPGEIKAWIGHRFYAAAFAKDATVENVVDALIAKINANTNRPFTVAKGAGPGYVITVTARNKGPEGNSIWIRVEVTPSTGVAAAVVAMASGTGAGDPTAGLALAQPHRFHLICLGTSDATTLGALSAHQEAQSTAAAQKWGIGIVATTGNRTAAETLADDDSYNSQVFCVEECPLPSWELAARFAADRGRLKANEPVIDRTLKGVPAPYDRTKWWDDPECEAALSSGVTPGRAKEDGTVEVVRSVVTRQTTPAYIDHTYEEIWHYTAECIIGAFKLLKGRRLKSASPAGRPTTVTPTRATAVLNRMLFRLDKDDYLQGVKESIKQGHNFCEVNGEFPQWRLDAACDYFPVGILGQAAIKATLRKELSVDL